ncbi:unnamed protein product [Bursaphelenchus xylophilus]|uniref:(pine wood nematode) hypothetical protein n=1 Tax=Bursaphelenchus xylophilus TaxID=6326 RepID=A0A7I8X136_BURXY|nr:unnamed protein product [Bursaphelenchus xylophilus]CAG9130188.1 unnamed protein product [Bursaphelenchus xylophilus]
MFIRTKSNFRMAQNSNDVIRQLQKELDEKAGPYVSEEYLKLARKFATKKISLAIFEKKAKGLIPIDLHSRFILNIADFMDMSLDECFKRTRKRKKSLAEEIFDQIYYHLISVYCIRDNQICKASGFRCTDKQFWIFLFGSDTYEERNFIEGCCKCSGEVPLALGTPYGQGF